MKVIISILALFATIDSVDGEALRGARPFGPRRTSLAAHGAALHHASTFARVHHGKMHIFHSQHEAESYRRLHHVAAKKPFSGGNPMIGIMTMMMGGMMEAQQGKMAAAHGKQSSIRAPQRAAKAAPRRAPKAVRAPPPPKPSAEEAEEVSAEEAEKQYVWTQEGIDTVNAKGIAGFLGNPTVGSTVTAKQTRMAKNYGKWDLAIKQGWIEAKAEEVPAEPEASEVSEKGHHEASDDDEFTDLIDTDMEAELAGEEKKEELAGEESENSDE